MIKKISFTQNGYNLLISELHELTSTRKSALIELQKARDWGSMTNVVGNF